MRSTLMLQSSGYFCVLRKFISLSVILCCLLVSNVFAHTPIDPSVGAPDPFMAWKTLETEHFRINYQAEHHAYAQKMAATAEQVHEKTTVWMNWVPKDKTEIVINDNFDGSNGGASSLPYNRFFIFMNTPTEGELQDHGAWLELVFTHEYIHILHLDQATELPGLVRNVFGRLFLAFPQIFNPKWITEGLAVYGETEKDKGFGRGQGVIYHAMMREEVANGLRSLSELSYQGYRSTDWPSGQVYVYGYYFFEYLESRYSRKDIVRYIQNWNKNIIPWRMDNRSAQVFGMSAKTLWMDYQQYLEKKFRPEILALKKQRENTSWQTGTNREHSNPKITGTGELYFYQNNGKIESSIERIDTNQQQHRVATVHGFSQFDWHDKQGILLSRLEICDNTNIYADLYHWNSNIKEWDRLTQCGRYPRVAWRSDGKYIVAVHVEKGRTNLELLDGSGKMKVKLPALPDGDTIGDVDWYVPASELPVEGKGVANSGVIVAAIKRKQTGWNLELLDVNHQQWKVLTRNGDVESKPQFSADGKYVYFLSDRENGQNVRKLVLETGEVSTVSDSASYVRAFSAENKQIALMEYQADGFSIRTISESSVYNNRAKSQSYSAVSKQPLNIPSFENTLSDKKREFTDIKDYNPWPSIKPRAWWAVLLADGTDNTSIQAIVDGSDALGFHQWQFAPQIFLDKEELGGDASYIFYNRLALLASRKVDIEQDSEPENNKLEVKDIENRFQAILMLPINNFEQSFRVHAGVARESVDRYIENNGHLEAEDNLLGVSLQFSNIEYYVHSISQEDGRRIKLNYEQYNTFGGGTFDGPVATLDWREYISVGNNHVLSLRWVRGQASSNAKPFELGGNFDQFDSLAGNIGFGLSDYALRGYDGSSSKLRGSRMNLLSAEWRIPLVEVFNGWMAPPVGLGKTAMSVFVDTGRASGGGNNGRYYTGVGVELKPNVLIGLDNFLLDMRLGLAQGLDDDLGETNVYFSLGTSF
ncbi:hypothetical protein A9Q81_03155 [Gammaproteobacteria bacterium 42_54_T18]|mgnify:CR=1 FL=1|nr:hypothetical protein A9Q81_03155 [Gammaproteobacteria bacterium 42_54_T18]